MSIAPCRATISVHKSDNWTFGRKIFWKRAQLELQTSNNSVNTTLYIDKNRVVKDILQKFEFEKSVWKSKNSIGKNRKNGVLRCFQQLWLWKLEILANEHPVGCSFYFVKHHGTKAQMYVGLETLQKHISSWNGILLSIT